MSFFRDDEFVRTATGQAVSGAKVYWLTNQPGATTSTVNLALVVPVFQASTGGVVANPQLTDGQGHAVAYLSPNFYTVAYMFNGLVQQVYSDVEVNAGFFNASNLINVQQFGATGAGTAAPSAASINASSNTLTLTIVPALPARFSSADVGKAIIVAGAGVSGRDLNTTIASFVSATQVTLTLTAGTSVTTTDAYWFPVGQDDTAAIQAAINSALPNQQIVYLPGGVYVISSQLTNSKALGGFIGDGTSSTYIISASSTTNANLVTFTDVPFGFRFSGMTLKGPGKIVASGTQKGVQFLLSTNNGIVERLRYEDVRITGTSDNGFTIQCPIVSYFGNSTVDNCAGNGFTYDRSPGGLGGTSCVIDDCYANGCGKIGHYLHSMFYTTMNGCAADTNGVSYKLDNCFSVNLVGCGTEEAVFVSATYPGHSYWFYGSFACTATGCYSIVTHNNAAQIKFFFDNNSSHCRAISPFCDVSATPATFDIVCAATVGTCIVDSPLFNDPGTRYENLADDTNVLFDGLNFSNLNVTGLFAVAPSGTAHPRLAISSAGAIDFGSGTLVTDTEIFRFAPGSLAFTGTAGGGIFLSGGTDTFSRLALFNDAGGVFFGPGNGASDATISRSGVATLAIGQSGYADRTGSVLGNRFLPLRLNATFGTTTTIDASKATTFQTLLTGNTTLAITNPTDGQFLTLVWEQDGTGSRTLTYPSNVKGGVTISAGISSKSAQTFLYSAFDGQWLATSTGQTNM